MAGEDDVRLQEMTKSVQELTNSMIHIRNSFQQTYKELDGTVNLLATKKKEFQQIKKDITQKSKAAKTPVNKETKEKLKEIQSGLNDLNQRLTPATGR